MTDLVYPDHALQERRTFLKASIGMLGTPFSLTAVTQTTGKINRPTERSRLALVLGAGSLRGLAHIGVLKALVEAQIVPDLVVGVSAGSLVGAFFAAGFTPWQIEDIALRVSDIDIADFDFSNKRGMLAGIALQKLVNTYLRGMPIEKMKIRFGALATHLSNGNPVIFDRGNTGLAVRASCSIPGVFVPTMVNGQEMVDGGVSSPLPVKRTRAIGANFVIAVNVGTSSYKPTGTQRYETLLQSFDISSHALASQESQSADLLISPNTSPFSSTDFSMRKEIIQAGYEAGLKAIPELKLKLGHYQVRPMPIRG
jgi:NTE family protein